MHHLKYAKYPATLAALALAGALGVAGCGSSTVSPSAVAALSVTSTIVNLHSHTVNVSASDQLHPADTTYTTSLSVDHTHTVTLTASQLTTIENGGEVKVKSSANAVTGVHTHDFTFQGKK